MKYTAHELCLQEVPGEVCLAFSISNCPLRCPGCHSSELQTDIGEDLHTFIFEAILNSYKAKHTNNFVFTCVLFFGGDQHEKSLVILLKLAKSLGLKTCLYTGSDIVSTHIQENLDYLKTGPYIKAQGSLMNRNTNQRLMDLHTNEDITYKLWENT